MHSHVRRLAQGRTYKYAEIYRDVQRHVYRRTHGYTEVYKGVQRVQRHPARTLTYVLRLVAVAHWATQGCPHLTDRPHAIGATISGVGQ